MAKRPQTYLSFKLGVRENRTHVNQQRCRPEPGEFESAARQGPTRYGGWRSKTTQIFEYHVVLGPGYAFDQIVYHNFLIVLISK